jgi:type II secretory pathway component HofQ
MMRLLVIACVLAAAPAYAERELCTPGAVHRGPTVDLDVKDAAVTEVYRLLSDVGRVNLVMADDITGKITLRLKRVVWSQVACTVAAVHKLAITVQGEGVPGALPIYLIRRRVDQRPPGG